MTRTQGWRRLAAMPSAAHVDSSSVVLLIVLLLGSIAAGIVFASPLGRRYRQARPGEPAPPRIPAAWRGAARTAASAARQRWTTLYPLLVGPADGPDRTPRATTTNEAEPPTPPSTRPVASPSTWSTGPALSDERYRPR
jgi:hypothetical protein